MSFYVMPKGNSPVLAGGSAPASGLGNVGDLYIDTAAARLYGPKTLTGWGSGVLIRGADGAPGAPGEPGAAGSQGPQGEQGPPGPPLDPTSVTIGDIGGLQAALDSKQVAGDYAPSSHTHSMGDVVGLYDTLDLKQAAGDYALSSHNHSGVYAPLVSGSVPSQYLPSYVDDVIELNSISGVGGGETGKIYVAKDTNKVYRWSGSAYIEISPSPGSTDAVAEGATNLYHTTARAAAAAPVQSVSGKTGTVTLAKGDVGLGNVDNTSDASKPVSTAVQTALDGKANATHTHSAADVSGLASVATSGSYNDLTNKPSIPAAYTLPVATSSVLGGVKQGSNVTIDGSGAISVAAPVTSLPYSSITGTPSLSTVATSGSYSDLTNKPNIIKAAVEWTANHTVADGTRYLAGDLVYAGGRVYVALFDNESLPVTNATYWQDLGPGYRLNIDGRDIQNIPSSGGGGGSGNPTVVTLTYSATLATNASTGSIFDVVLTGAATIANPTNGVNGQTLRWRITQDATGGRAVTLGNKFALPSSVPSLTFSTAANATDILAATYHQPSDRWHVVALVTGY